MDLLHIASYAISINTESTIIIGYDVLYILICRQHRDNC